MKRRKRAGGAVIVKEQNTKHAGSERNIKQARK